MVNRFIKRHIQALVPYSTARDEFTGKASVYLDANENPFGSSASRYPDPHQRVLKERIAKLKGVVLERIFLGNGSDEAIDLLVRIFDTSRGGITITSPTYGMYKVAAANNAVEVFDAPLKADFSLDLVALKDANARGSRLLFLCSPNNPTGRQYRLQEITTVLDIFDGIVVVDEAYIDFAQEQSAITLLDRYDRVVVLQTFSKAWGMAGVRLGMAFATRQIIESMNKLKLPYNISELSQRYALERIAEPDRVREEVRLIVTERDRVSKQLLEIRGVEDVFPSQANFLLIKVADSGRYFEHLQKRGIIVRDRSKEINCQGCLRVTIGTPEENSAMLEVLREVR